MRRDPATRGTAIILFGIAIILFGATQGPNFPILASGLLGLVIAIVGLVDALTDSGPKS
jgi:UDP-N-acetylmuramyl pentapeptide phosphotransferase/UDP-N-acetylglucosamine-1-phosphate transferase